MSDPDKWTKMSNEAIRRVQEGMPRSGASRDWSREDVLEFLEDSWGDGRDKSHVDLMLLVEDVRSYHLDRTPQAPDSPPEVDQYIQEFLLKLVSKMTGIPNVVHALLTIRKNGRGLGGPVL